MLNLPVFKSYLTWFFIENKKKLRQTVLKKDLVFWRQVVLTKVFLFSVKTLMVSFRLTYCIYSLYQIHPQYPLPSTAQSKWHIIHQLRKGEAGHMHNFLPLHGFTLPCQRSPWNSTKEKQKNNTDWMKRLFFSSPLLLRVRGSSKVPLPPASFLKATFSSLQDTLSQTILSPHTHPLIRYDMTVEGAGRMLRTRWRPGGSRLFKPSWLSSFRAAPENFPSSAFLHRRKSLLSRPVEPGETNTQRNHL